MKPNRRSIVLQTGNTGRVILIATPSSSPKGVITAPRFAGTGPPLVFTVASPVARRTKACAVGTFAHVSKGTNSSSSWFSVYCTSFSSIKCTSLPASIKSVKCTPNMHRPALLKEQFAPFLHFFSR